MQITLPPDILEQLQQDFPAEMLDEIVGKLLSATTSERIQRCIAFAARGHRGFFDYLCRLAKVDYRDVIMTAEYARLDGQLRLYDFARPIPSARIDQWFPDDLV